MLTLDGGGHVDVVVGHRQCRMAEDFLQGPSQAGTSCRTGACTETTTGAYAIEVADLDGDGEPDIVCANPDDMVIFWGGR